MSVEANRTYFWKVAERTHAEDVLAKLKLGNPNVQQEDIIKALAFAIGNLNAAVPIISGFMADVEAVGVDEVRNDDVDNPTSWPDLAETYDKAKAFMEGT